MLVVLSFQEKDNWSRKINKYGPYMELAVESKFSFATLLRQSRVGTWPCSVYPAESTLG